jgi:hypothetical protein
MACLLFGFPDSYEWRFPVGGLGNEMRFDEKTLVAGSDRALPGGFLGSAVEIRTCSVKVVASSVEQVFLAVRVEILRFFQCRSVFLRAGTGYFFKISLQPFERRFGPVYKGLPVMVSLAKNPGDVTMLSSVCLAFGCV